ncbi:MAG: prepilin-type N-terminal cleavage/methylation domain-containing protein [Candidatus Omnitrophica bacterium]|nr:prepilin-type N-terminal cleavage/methylation domain-containing protein [Candidatus Omnitrophota bacterium]
MRRRYRQSSGFTLIEVLIVLVVLSILGGVFFTVFVTNWDALEDRITRTNMWHDANDIIESMTNDGRFAKTVDVQTDDEGNRVTDFIDFADQLFVTYKITPDGRFLMERDGKTKVMSTAMDPAQTGFNRQGQGLRVSLALKEELLRREITISTATEIYPRNINSPNLGTPES